MAVIKGRASSPLARLKHWQEQTVMPKSIEQLLVFVMIAISHVQSSLASEQSLSKIPEKKEAFTGFYRLRLTR
jgi:hypothetical protein